MPSYTGLRCLNMLLHQRSEALYLLCVIIVYLMLVNAGELLFHHSLQLIFLISSIPVDNQWFLWLQIKTPAQLDAAFSFLTAIASDNLKVDDFEAACGVGMMHNVNAFDT